MVPAVTAATGPALPAKSVTALIASFGIIVPSVHPEIVTVYAMLLDVETLYEQPVEVPVFEKFADVGAFTCSLNVNT